MTSSTYYTPVDTNYAPESPTSVSHMRNNSSYSLTPLNRPSNETSYPPKSQDLLRPPLVQSDTSYRTSTSVGGQNTQDHEGSNLKRPAPSPKGSNWDIMSGIKKLGDDFEHFDTRNATAGHLQFAEGDLPKAGAIKFYNWLLNVSIVTRWALFIIPVLGLLWIPGILGLTAFPNAKAWDVKLLWWSIWLTVLWAGWWAAIASARILPYLLKWTIGVISVESRNYIQWLAILHRYVALVGWSVASFISFEELVQNRMENPNDPTNSKSADILSFIRKFALAIVICSGLLLGEKIGIQMVAQAFHERSYADRIEEQKRARRILVILYSHSSDIRDRDDTLRDGHTAEKGAFIDPRRLLKRALREFRDLAKTTTTALGNVASEIAGSSVLQPNSPQAMVAEALISANKSRMLARRLFYSFRSNGASAVVLTDIAPYFASAEEAVAAFSLFDKDGNGDCTRDEFETACLECHREQLSIANSMRDLDSAVGRLDNIFMSLYSLIALLIIAVTLEAEFTTIVTGAGTLILGLSWLIGGSLQEVLTSIIFVFVKHPYDVGDRVQIEKDIYTVKEIRLLSTIFLDSDNALSQAPNVVLNSKFIVNIRRSPQMSESFSWDVAFGTSFEAIEALRAKMLAFVKSERRDFLPAFDVIVVDIAEQKQMTLRSDIKYKSNWQQGALKSKRRNMWICALKTAMGELKIYGPSGDPSAIAGPQQVTMVPWETVQARAPEKEESVDRQREPNIPRGKWALSDKNAQVLDPSLDVFGETSELYTSQPRDQTGASSVPEGLPRSGRRKQEASSSVDVTHDMSAVQ